MLARILTVPVLLALLGTAAPATAQAIRPLSAPIDSVTVYPGFATVVRRADFPPQGGVFEFGGLPLGLDPNSLRVRAEGGEVTRVELRETGGGTPAAGSYQELSDVIAALEAEWSVLADELAVNSMLAASVRGMLTQTAQAGQNDVVRGHPNAAAWRETLQFVKIELSALDDDERKLVARRAVVDARMKSERSKLNEQMQLVTKRERAVSVVVVDTSGASASTRELTLEYLVNDAGWEPTYDLRANEAITSVELIYRAKVWQRSGEDWNNAKLTLSTARPRRGARGPELTPRWLGLGASSKHRGYGEDVRALRGLGYVSDSSMDAINKTPGPSQAEQIEATVLSGGPVVRFELPRRETVASRHEKSQVFVGRSILAVQAELVCVPALDTTVWLRGRTTNTSPFVMLRGSAAVYLGSSFLGNAAFDAVRPGEEFTLHLGADDGLSVKRTRVARETGSSGVFSKRVEQDERWRIEIMNHDGHAGSDGIAQVIVHELLPKSAHEDLGIEIVDVRPRLARSERWTKLEEETGARTWVVNCKRGESVVLEIATRITYPQGTRLSAR